MTSRLEAWDLAVHDAVEELKQQAFAGNIERPHHLADAIEAFEDIGVILKASSIIHELLDDEEEPDGT